MDLFCCSARPIVVMITPHFPYSPAFLIPFPALSFPHPSALPHLPPFSLMSPVLPHILILPHILCSFDASSRSSSCLFYPSLCPSILPTCSNPLPCAPNHNFLPSLQMSSHRSHHLHPSASSQLSHISLCPPLLPHGLTSILSFFLLSSPPPPSSLILSQILHSFHTSSRPSTHPPFLSQVLPSSSLLPLPSLLFTSSHPLPGPPIFPNIFLSFPIPSAPLTHPHTLPHVFSILSMSSPTFSHPLQCPPDPNFLPSNPTSTTPSPCPPILPYVMDYGL